MHVELHGDACMVRMVVEGSCQRADNADSRGKGKKKKKSWKVRIYSDVGSWSILSVHSLVKWETSPACRVRKLCMRMQKATGLFKL